MDTFLQDTLGNAEDQALVTLSLAGDRAALESLLRRHSGFIYNAALRLFLDRDDAQDATQEVLIKVLTQLKNYRADSAFRTWLYRITVNHFLTLKRKKTEIAYAQLAASLPSSFSDYTSEVSEEVTEDTRILCSMGMLMCLDREQRLLFVVGDLFGASSKLGAELFGLSGDNYRQRLSRARQDLRAYVQGRCGLVDASNPCRCPKKAKALVAKGIVNPDSLRYFDAFALKVEDVIHKEVPAVADEVYHRITTLFATQPYYALDELENLLDGLTAQMEP